MPSGMKAIINFEELKKGKSSRGQLGLGCSPGLAEEPIGGTKKNSKPSLEFFPFLSSLN